MNPRRVDITRGVLRQYGLTAVVSAGTGIAQSGEIMMRIEEASPQQHTGNEFMVYSDS